MYDHRIILFVRSAHVFETVLFSDLNNLYFTFTLDEERHGWCRIIDSLNSRSVSMYKLMKSMNLTIAEYEKRMI